MFMANRTLKREYLVFFVKYNSIHRHCLNCKRNTFFLCLFIWCNAIAICYHFLAFLVQRFNKRTFHSLSSPNYGMCPGEGLYVPDRCELTFANTLLLTNAAVSLGGAVVSLESSCSFSILFSLFSGILAWAFISLQIKEFRVMGFSINDSVYSSVFSLLTGLHFFHLVVGLFLLSLYFCSCSFQYNIQLFEKTRTPEVHLFYNL